MSREDWLKSLKSGDKVANKTTSGFNREVYYETLEVKNITNKGNIRLTNGILLNSNGEYHKYENWNSTDYLIEPLTNEILEYEKNRREHKSLRYEVAELCDNFRKEQYTIEELKKLKEILKKE